MEELAEQRPTVLLIEDAHWADDATVDVLGYAARRVELARRAARGDPARRGAGPGPSAAPAARDAGRPAVHRLELAPLSREAVDALAAGTGRDAGAVHALTAGNPFFVTEALAAPPDEVPGERQGRRARAPAPGQPRVRATRSSGSRSCRRPFRASWPQALLGAGAGNAGRGRAGRADRGPPGRDRVPARAGAARDRGEPAGDPPPAAQPGRGRARCATAASSSAPGCCTTRPRRATSRRCSRRARRRRARRPARARTARRSRTSRP